MSKNTENKTDKEQTPVEEGKKNYTLLYIAIGCLAVSAVLFALAFILSGLTPLKGAGVYLLIASMLFALASASFLNGQKRKSYNTVCKIVRVLSYVLMVAALAVFVIGASLAGTAK